MAVSKCKDCGNQVSKKAKQCPHCGRPQRRTSTFTWLITIFFAIGLIGAIMSPPTSTSTSGSMPSAKPAERQPSAEELAAAKAAEEASCRQDLQCLGDKHTVGAATYCQPLIERHARYDYEWTDSWTEPKMARFRWKHKENGVITFIGDKVKFQNGFGAWQNMIYFCDYDTINDQVLTVTVEPGRIS